MKYLLDTNICIYIIKKKPAEVLEKFRKIAEGEICISAITVSELSYGVYNSLKIEQNLSALFGFLAPLCVLDFNTDDAIEYGKLRSELKKSGRIIGAMDMLIASQARSKDLILVTNNSSEFEKVNNLKIENWVKTGD